MTSITLAIPSKGRLMEQTTEAFAACGLELRRTGTERGYRGEIVGLKGVDVAYVSSSEIAAALKTGSIHLGVTGEDLVREAMSDADTRVMFLRRLGFGFADVVVAVPDCWIDVTTVAELTEIAVPFRRAHGRWPRVATKYTNLTRRFFAAKGFGDYRIVESLGATEGTPASGTADLIVDITTTGATLKANGLRILADGVVLKSQANLISASTAPWDDDAKAICDRLVAKLAKSA